MHLAVLISLLLMLSIANHATAQATLAEECIDWQLLHPEWIWCDDFESDSALEANYFEVNRAGGRLAVSGDAAFAGSQALKANYLPGSAESGNVKLSFGRTPILASPTLQPLADFNEVYWRFYIRVASGWQDNARKISRAIIFSDSNWSQAAIGHHWEGNNGSLTTGLDPVSGVIGDTVVTNGYNDFDNMIWLGKANGSTEVYAPDNQERWICMELQMKLNNPGLADGEFRYWIDGTLEAERSGLNWRGSYDDYGINALFLEHYMNGGSPQAQSRFLDNFVVSTQPIGCYDGSGTPGVIADAGGPYNAMTGVPVEFDASRSAVPANGEPASYAWDFGDGSSGTGVAPMHTYFAEGTFTAILTVTDDLGQTDSDTTSVIVVSDTTLPVAVAGGPYSSSEGQLITFDATASYDPDGGPIEHYHWNFGDGSTGSGATTVHSYDSSGSYTVSLTVTDDDGEVSEASTSATVSAPECTPELTITRSVWTGKHVRLTILGEDTALCGPIMVSNAGTSEVLASKEGSGPRFRITLRKPQPVPCSVRAQQGSTSIQAPVENAPSGCR
jgi:PKD repeat protein